METTAESFLAIYLNDHLAGAAAGVDRARSLAQAHRDGPDEERLRRLAENIAADRGALLSIMMSLGVPVRRYKSIAFSVAEKAGRLKLNGQLRGRPPLTDVIEAEALRLAVEGKSAGWRALLALADRYPALDAGDLQKLLERADAQADVLESFRKAAVERAFGRPANVREGKPGAGTATHLH
jgi:hypothetical protein